MESSQTNVLFIILCAVGAVFGGALLPIQAGLNLNLSITLQDNPIRSAFVSFFVGTIYLFLCLLKTHQFSVGTIFTKCKHLFTSICQNKIEFLIFFNGIIGAIFATSVIYLSPIIGFALYYMCVVCGQILFSIFVDLHPKLLWQNQLIEKQNAILVNNTSISSIATTTLSNVDRKNTASISTNNINININSPSAIGVDNASATSGFDHEFDRETDKENKETKKSAVVKHSDNVEVNVDNGFMFGSIPTERHLNILGEKKQSTETTDASKNPSESTPKLSIFTKIGVVMILIGVIIFLLNDLIDIGEAESDDDNDVDDIDNKTVEWYFYVLYSLIAIFIGVIAVVRTGLTRRIKYYVGSSLFATTVDFFNSMIVLLVVNVAMFVYQYIDAINNNNDNEKGVKLIDNDVNNEWYYWIGGILGSTYILVTIFVPSHIGFIATFICTIFGNFLISIIFDTFGVFGIEPQPLTWNRIIGAIFVFISVILANTGKMIEKYKEYDKSQKTSDINCNDDDKSPKSTTNNAHISCHNENKPGARAPHDSKQTD